MIRPAYDLALEREYLARGWWADDTLTAWLDRHARERPDAPAVHAAGSSFSWIELRTRVMRAAGGLRRRGVRKGDVVAAQLPNVPEFLVAYLATCRLGGVFCTVHMPYRGAEIDAITGHSGAKVFLNAPSQIGDLEQDAPAEGLAPPDPRDPFLLLYTSGTTASPKGVPHAYRGLLGNARLGAPEHRLTAADRILCAAPLSHLYGLYSLHCAWAVGACTVLLPAFKPDALAALVQEAKPTALWTAPAHVAACRNAGLFESHDWSSLKLAIVSGSSAPPDLVFRMKEKLEGCEVTQLWGMTELQAGLYSRPGDPIEVSALTTGRASPGTEVRLAEDGELQVRGPIVFTGYYRNDEATREAFTPDGWFRSGDLAEWRDGNVAITGRTKDIINRGGVKFNPAEVEMLLDSHPGILQSAIVPIPDPVLGERACAFVVPRSPASPPALEDLVSYLLSRGIAKNKLPERLVVIAEMPLTPTRKIIKGRLRIP